MGDRLRAPALLLLLLASCTIRPTPEGLSPALLRAQPPEAIWIGVGGFETANAGALVHAGSAFDPIGQEGLSYRAAVALLHEPALQVEGLSLEVEVGREWVFIEASGPPDAAEDVLELLARALTWGPPSEAALARASLDAEAALQAIEADPERLAAEALELFMYEGHPYGHPVPGRRGVAGLHTPEQVGAHRARTWVRESVHVATWGDVDPTLAYRLTPMLEPLPAGQAPRPVPGAHRRLDGLELLLIESELPLAGLALGQPFDRRRGPVDLDDLKLAAGGFDFGAAELRLSAADFDPRDQPALTLSLPPMPATEGEDALRGALDALTAWRGAPERRPSDPLSGREAVLHALINQATRSPQIPGADVLPDPDDAFIVVVTDEADALLAALTPPADADSSEENADSAVKGPDTPGRDPLSFSSTTRIPQDGLFR